MSYDIIDTLVEAKSKGMEPATIVQLEGNVQFTKLTPLEVAPIFTRFEENVRLFFLHVGRVQQDFVLCGYYLNLIKRENLYRYCVQDGKQGYTNFYTFCERVLGVSETSAKRLILINHRFCDNERELPERYQNFGASKLAIMATFENGLEEKITPTITVQKLEKLRKFYVSQEWNVDKKRGWWEDLSIYEENAFRERMQSRARLRKYKFESAKDKVLPTPTNHLVSVSYKAYTRFFDQTLKSLRELQRRGDAGFEPLLKDVETFLMNAQATVLRAQGLEMLEGL